MAIAYYGVKLSPNWVETPEGYVICKNAVIGRTGFQTYKGRELDRKELADQGITVDDEQDVNLFRDPAEVFSDKTIASFVGKSVTDGHPAELVDLDTVKEHEDGQVINVRPGSEPLESGDLPLLADLILKSKTLIEKIKAGLRELSCGYNYHVLRDGEIIKQVDIIGNHVAIVESARAGREAVIVDSAITPAGDILMTIPILDRILGSNRKSKLVTWAKDAKPEEVADVLDLVVGEIEKGVHKPVAMDSATDTKDVAKDAAKDASSDRKRLHDALDRVFERSNKKETAMDADIEELENLFKKWGRDEKEKEELSDAAADSDADDEKADDEEADDSDADDEEEEEKEEAKDEEAGAMTIEPSDRPVSAGPGADALREARREGARDALKLIKPVIARTGNKKLIFAFDTAYKSFRGKSAGKTSDGYGKFVKAATNRGREAQDSVATSASTAIKMLQDAEKMYKDVFNAGNQRRSL